jgi:hypothetical protein
LTRIKTASTAYARLFTILEDERIEWIMSCIEEYAWTRSRMGGSNDHGCDEDGDIDIEEAFGNGITSIPLLAVIAIR